MVAYNVLLSLALTRQSLVTLAATCMKIHEYIIYKEAKYINLPTICERSDYAQDHDWDKLGRTNHMLLGAEIVNYLFIFVFLTNSKGIKQCIVS